MNGAAMRYFLNPCECCDNGCDCGCLLDCPRHRASADVEVHAVPVFKDCGHPAKHEIGVMMSDREHPGHIRDDQYDEDCRACSDERNALLMSTYGETMKLLASLPPRSVVLDYDLDAWQKDDEGLWTCTVRVENTHATGAESVAIMGVLEVIYTGPADVEICAHERKTE